MFRLENSFWEKLENKYRKSPVISTVTGKPLKFSVNNLTQSLQDFIDKNLRGLDVGLYQIIKQRNKNIGYKKDNIYRLFKATNPDWNPYQELVDLLCFYSFNMPYEEAVNKGLISNNLSQFILLKSERIATVSEHKILSDKLENKLLSSYQKIIDLTIYLDDFDLSLVSFDKHDLDVLKRLQPLKESLGEIHWDIIENRFFVNPNIVRGLKIISPDSSYIVGFYIMYPITKNCQSKIEKGEITKSDDFSLVDICKDFKISQAIYISLVFAIDRLSKAFLLLKLKEELRSIILKYPNIKTIYVRPVTDDGLRNVERQKFFKMKNSSSLYTQDTKYLADFNM